MSYLKIEDNDFAENKVYFWHGLLDPNGLGEDYQAVIEKINEGNYQGLDLEKLVGHNVFSARINDSARMLFTTIYVNDEPYLLLLDVVLNHDYHKSRFLKPAVLKHYLELNGKAFAEEITKAQFEKPANPPPAPAANRKQPTQYSKVEFFNQKFFEFDELQQGALVKAQKTLPLVIEGVAGSGKSCLALSLFAQYVEANIENNPQQKFPILYVTESEDLAKHLKEIWLGLPNAQGLGPNDVQFKSYEQLVKELDPEAAKKTFVGKEACYTWITNQIKNYKKNKKAQKEYQLENSFNSDPEALYQEFRIISGCHSFDEYKDRGRKQSLYPNEKEKKWIYDTYQNYQKEKIIHAPFYALKLVNKFKLVVVDEAQDLSHLQLENLSLLACDNQICFCQDKRQSLADVKSKLPFLKTLMFQSEEEFNHTNLPYSRRCKEAIIAMANAASGLKASVTGQRDEDLAVPAGPNNNKGSVKWLDKESELVDLKNLASDPEVAPDFAIITPKKFKAQAEKLFPKNDVYTPEEIKGREYKSVMTYRLFDENPLFKDAEKLLKKGEINEQFATLFSPVFTAFTRPTDNLYIYQEENYQLQTIIQTLQSALPKEQNEAIKALPKLSAEAINEKWFSRVKEHLSNGEIKKARKIYVETLKKTPEEFEELKKLFCAPAPVQPTVKQPIVNNNSPKTNSNNNNSGKTSQKSNSKQANTNTNEKTAKSTNQTPNYTAKNDTFFFQTQDGKKDRKAEQDSYLAGLVAAPTFYNLSTLLELKRPKYYMFHHPLEDGACLFTSLFYTAEGRDRIFDMLDDPLYEDIFKGITQEALCRPRELPYKLLLTANIKKREQQKIYDKTIRSANQEAARDYCDTSPLYWFFSSEKGVKAFDGLLTLNPSLAQAVSAEALCLPRPAEAQNFANFSPLLLLSKLIKGAQIFKMLLLHNQELAQGITAEALCLPLTYASGQNFNMTPLYCFSITTEGMEALRLLCTQNPKLAGEIKGEALCLKYTLGKFKNTTPLYFLSMFDEGIELLDILLDHNPELVKTITGEALCLAPNTISPLYHLTRKPERLLLLIKLLFGLNQNLRFSITGQALCLPQRTAEEPENASALYWLSSTKEGRELLLLLLANNNLLAQTISIEALTRKLPDTAGEHASKSPMDWLISTEEGHHIIEALSSVNPKIDDLMEYYALMPHGGRLAI